MTDILGQIHSEVTQLFLRLGPVSPWAKDTAQALPEPVGGALLSGRGLSLGSSGLPTPPGTQNPPEMHGIFRVSRCPGGPPDAWAGLRSGEAPVSVTG